ncbi:MAG: DNA-formamidopyrimidine glycosylase family protein [Actinomycetota bacterium]
MPEGHVLHRAARLQGRRFRGKAVRTTSPQGRFADGAATLNGQTVVGIDALGKHIFYRFDEGDVLHVHLGLFGKFRVRSLPAPEPSPNARLVMESETDHLHLAGPTACELITPEEEDDLRARLGPDPILDPADGADELERRLARRSISIGAALLDQKVVAGIGNVYRSELLFLAGIHPLTIAKTLERWAIDDIWLRSVTALTDGEKMGKIVTVLPDEMGVESPRELKRGDRLYVYKRTGAPCRRCAEPIQTADADGRNVWWCPVCQPETVDLVER